jgi:hypothetical protein
MEKAMNGDETSVISPIHLCSSLNQAAAILKSRCCAEDLPEFFTPSRPSPRDTPSPLLHLA